MDLRALQSYLDSIARGGLTLDAGDGKLASELRAFLQTLPGGALHLSMDPARGISLDGSTLTIQGASTDAWEIAGPGGPGLVLGQATVTITDHGASPPDIAMSSRGSLRSTSATTLPVALASP